VIHVAALLLAGALLLPTEPIPRIETGRHTAFIHALAFDAATGRLYSASEDKTIRVWRIGDGRLLETYRVPAGFRSEGQLYALALSPDGKRLAAGGWTCWDTEGAACIYLLDAATGEILHRITGLPEVVATLGFSPDGLHLAVGLMGARGLRVFRVADRALVAEDQAYRGNLLELDFTGDGRMVTTSLDGFVRTYDRRFTLAGRIKAGLPGVEPFGVRYSPDGRYIAVGFNDVARVSVLRSADLSVVAELTAPKLGKLTRIAWTADGSSLYGAGEPAGLLRWQLSNPGRAQPLPAAAGRIGDLIVTPNGFVAFGAEDPALGLLDPSGRRLFLLGSGVPDHRRAALELRISHDASVVEIPLSGALRAFSVTQAQLVHPDAKLPTPVTSARGWLLTDARNERQLKINGHAVSLDRHETVHARALTPDRSHIVLGTEWMLRLADRNGAIRWSVRMPTSVRAVNVSGDGRFVVAALSDGTINWFRAGNGTPVLGLFLHIDGESWAAWTPQGEYASSVHGDNFVGWHLNRGPDVAPDFFRAVQFEREWYRPQALAASLFGNSVATATASALRAIAPPRLQLRALPAGGDAHIRRIRVVAESDGLPMRDMVAYVNDIPLTSFRDRSIGARETHRVVRDFDLHLTEADNDIRIEVSNGRSLGVGEHYIASDPNMLTSEASGDLYVLAVGANRFPGLGASLSLTYAASDAKELARALSAAGTARFRKVHVRTLSDDGTLPTRAAVLSALQMLQQAQGSDTVMLFLASHGLSDRAGNYYFVPRDAKRADIDALLAGRSLSPESSLLPWSAFFETLRQTAGRRLLIVDTCQARNISGRFQEHSLVKRSASSRIAFVLASKGDEESQEYAPGGHGLFTYALLEGLRGRGDGDRDGVTTIAEWFGFAAGVVEQLRDRRIGPQTPQMIAPRRLQAMPVMDLRRAAAPAAGGRS
jgi:WD40 repeat protein